MFRSIYNFLMISALTAILILGFQLGLVQYGTFELIKLKDFLVEQLEIPVKQEKLPTELPVITPVVQVEQANSERANFQGTAWGSYSNPNLRQTAPRPRSQQQRLQQQHFSDQHRPYKREHLPYPKSQTEGKQPPLKKNLRNRNLSSRDFSNRRQTSQVQAGRVKNDSAFQPLSRKGFHRGDDPQTRDRQRRVPSFEQSAYQSVPNRSFKDFPSPVQRPVQHFQTEDRLQYQPRNQLPPEDPAASQNDAKDLVVHAEKVAIVGNQVILLGDLMGQVNQLLAPMKGKMPPEVYKQQRKLLMQKQLMRIVEGKLLYLDFLKGVPADKVGELNQSLEKQFEEKQLPRMVKMAKVKSATELDLMFRKMGSSLNKQRRNWAEIVLGKEALRKNVNVKSEIGYRQLWDEYQNNKERYAIKAKVRWERLMVGFDRFENKEQAFRAIAQMGNRVLHGAKFSQVAKKYSHGLHAREGGYHDWTNKGSLLSKKLDEAIFSLPLNRMSQIIEDQNGFHIVRVLERKPAGHIPFTTAQTEIKKKLQQESIKRQTEAYLAKLRKQTYIWTIFDQSQGGKPVQKQPQTKNMSSLPAPWKR